MTLTRRFVVLGLPAVVAACGTGSGDTSGGPQRIRPDAGGIAIQNTDLRIDFGRAEAGAVAAVTKVLGSQPQERTVNRACGAGPVAVVRYPQIDLLFQDGAFRGWVTRSTGTTTANGLAPGMRRNQLPEASFGPFRTTSLGVEFDSGGVFGLLPDGGADTPVQYLWAGVSCFFR